MKQKLTALFICLFACSNGTNSFGQTYLPNSWELKDTAGVPGRYFGAYFTIDSFIYVGTGYTGAGLSNDFWRYNVHTNSWSRLDSVPGVPRQDAVGFAINGMGYIGFGDSGTNNLSDIYQYNPTTATWSAAGTISSPFSTIGGSGTHTNSATSSMISFVVDGKAYVGLGSVASGTPRCNDSFFAYDPGSNTWSIRNVFGGPSRSTAIAFVVNDIAYVGTGANASGTIYSDFYKYNSSADSWTSISPLPESTNGGGGFGLCDFGYAGLGANNNIYQYNPGADSWSSPAITNYPGSAYGNTIATSVQSNELGYGYIGFGAPGTPPPNLFYQYSPPSQCIPASLSISSIKNNNHDVILHPNPGSSYFTLLSTDEIQTVQIKDIVGNILYQHKYSANQVEIDVTNFPAGIYIVVINNMDVRKFVKE